MLIRPLFIAIYLLAGNAFADVNDIIKALNPYIPNLQETDVAATPIEGIYEIIVTSPSLDIIYISGDGSFIIQGEIIDFNNGGNVTKRRIANLAKNALLSAKDEDKIIYPAEEEKYIVNVFTDVDCPYCRRLHSDIEELNNLGITVKYLAFPRSGVNTESFYKSESIWCSENQKEVMDSAMLQKDVASQKCSSPVIAHLNLAQDIGVTGTPYIFFENGSNIPGYVKPKALLKEINSSLAKFE
ncbi:MAG: thioredoxin fold domain-containing protein [PS1 clade bacterium]